jgi:hypothetical protein
VTDQRTRRIDGHLLNMSVSLMASGPDITIEQPMGKGGERLHEWLFQDDADRAAAADGAPARHRRRAGAGAVHID